MNQDTSSNDELSVMEKETNTKYLNATILILSVAIGLFFSWISFYFSIVLGFLSIGTGGLLVLVLAKIIFHKKKISEGHLALITIAYRSTSAAEASTALLFLIWLARSSRQLYGIDFNPPRWLLPSVEVLSKRLVFTSEWFLPLLVHWFLMLVPGLLGITLGWVISKHFLENEVEYRFPGIIQTKFLIQFVLSDDKEKRNTFMLHGIIGFIVSLLLVFLFPTLDFSSNRQVLGVILGIIGVILFSAGFLIKMPQITIFSLAWGFFFYVVLSSLLLPEDFRGGTSFLETHQAILFFLYFAFLIGLLIGSLFLGSILRELFKRKDHVQQREEVETRVLPPSKINDEENDKSKLVKGKPKNKIESRVNEGRFWLNKLTRRHVSFWMVYLIAYALTIAFVLSTNLLPVPFYVVAIILFWILIVGSIVNGFVVTQSIAKSSSSASIPFLFDFLPLYSVGARGFLPYIAIPRAETTETQSLVSSLKLGQIFHLRPRETLITYLSGYLAAVIMTPFFALLLWQSFGIGTNQLPAPTFPLLGGLIGAFASGNPLTFFEPLSLLLGLLGGMVIGPNAGLGAVLGLLFPLPMLIPMSLGGLVRVAADRFFDPVTVEDKGQLMATAWATGASLAMMLLVMIEVLFS